ncbi:MAG TPA: VCBS repeat-containing protein, partial [Polyangiaceae bacterium]|nr:VCBS repeat-containing protein [Polyangiaceae bacterium]
MTLFTDGESSLGGASNPSSPSTEARAGSASQVAGSTNQVAGSTNQTGGATMTPGNESSNSCDTRVARCPVGTICVSGTCVLKPLCSEMAPQTGPRTFSTGNGTSAIAVGDWNGDGFADISTTNSADSTVSVLLACGNGSFAPRVDYRVGAGPGALASCDLNGDFKLDLVSLDLKDETLTALLNQGDGSFKAKGGAQISSWGGPQALACADLNGDRFADLAVIGRGQGAIAVLLGLGDGTFMPRRDYAAGPTASAIALAIADVNGDGKPDVVTVAQSNDNVNALLGRGDGTLADPITRHGSYNDGITTLAVGDLNGDGRADLGVGDVADRGPAPHFGMMAGNEDGTFGPIVEQLSPPSVCRVAIGDFNGDAIADLVGLGSVSVRTLLGAPGGLQPTADFKLTD